MTPIAPHSRDSDERLLDWLAMRDRKMTTAQIAKIYHVSADYVRSITNQIRRASKEAEDNL